MASRKLRVDLEVKDSASGPIDKVKNNFDKLKSSVDKAEDATKKLKEQQEKLKKTSETLKKSSETVSRVLQVGFAAAAAAATAFGAAVYKSYEETSKLKGLEKVLNNGQVFRAMQDYAGKAGVSIEQLAEQGLALANAYNPEDALYLFKKLQDLTAKGIISKEKSGQATDAIAEIAHMTRVGESDFKKFQDIFGKGVNLESLSKLTGQTIPQLKKSLKDGNVSAMALLKTVLGLSNAPAGNEALEKAAKSIDAQLTNIKTSLSGVGMNVLKGVFGNEEEIAAGLSKINEKLKEVFTVENIKKTVDWFKKWQGTIEGLAVALVTLKAALGVSAIIAAGQAAIVAAGGFGAWATALWALLWPIGLVVAAVTGLFLLWRNWDWVKKKFNEFTQAVSDGLEDIWKYIKGIASDIYKAGSDIVMGLWNGIKDKFKSMLEWFKELTDQLPESIKKILGIASPSKVFKKLGMNTMEGFRFGLRHQSKAALAEQIGFNKKLIAVQTELSRNSKLLFAPWGISTPSDLNKLWSPELLAKASGTHKQEEEEVKQVINAAASSPSPFMKTLVPQQSNSKPQVINNVPISIKIDVKPGGVVDKNVESMLTEALQNSIIDILSKQIIS
jgi:hypothetical protein